MSNLIDLSGKRLQGPPGLYVAGSCPTCSSPIYYHGGGTDAEGQVHSHLYFPTCPCDFSELSEPVVMATPPEYDFPHERDSVLSLFTNLLDMLEHLHSLQERLDFFTNQIQVLEDDGGYPHEVDPDG